jgi:DNA-binding PadR family transcriptional regulator
LGTYVIGCYGVPNWFADIDQKRQYWKESEGIIAYILDFLSNEGFSEFLREAGAKWEDVQEYRDRHLIKAIKNRSFF